MCGKRGEKGGMLLERRSRWCLWGRGGESGVLGGPLFKWRTRNRQSQRSYGGVRDQLFTFDDLSVMTEELLLQYGMPREYSLLSSSVCAADVCMGDCIICLEGIDRGHTFITLEW